ncbi:MAG: ribonuclease H family protein [Candidatus Pacebacteria bacterium]|nr:ribonuclease H family protein [Candidatus Paceibacterota bacterium]
MKKQKFYAYSIGDKKGVTDNWPECQSIVSGKQGAKYKSFENKDDAKIWLEAGADYAIKHLTAEEGIYFDAGTGGGNGTEINVTDEKGESLLKNIFPSKELNSKGHYSLSGKTNNFGELSACKFALEISIKSGNKKIFGDSKLILDYWSKGFIKKDLPQETINLANEVKKLRYEYEKSGGQLIHISGGKNPADLGFHKGI